MIRYFYRTQRSPSLSEVFEYRRGAWVHAEDLSADEIVELSGRFKLETGLLEDALDEDEQPRLEREGGANYIFVRFAYKRSSGEIDTAPLLIIVGRDFVITVTKIHLPVLDVLLRGRIAFATSRRAKLVLLILSHMSDQYDVFINQTSRQIKGVRSRLRGKGITNKELVDFVTIEDELNEFLASLQPTNATLRRLLVGKYLPLQEEDQDIVEDLLLNNEQSIEASKANLKSISNIRDAYSAISANNLNRTIEILTVATVVLAVPNLFYALFGTNVKIPFEHTTYGFWIVIVISFVPLVVLGYIARKKHVL